MDLIKLLQKEFDSKNLIIDSENLVPYSVDESETGPFFPQAVLEPETPLEIEKLLKLALIFNFPVTPRGLGSGKSGGSLPCKGGVVLALDKMQKILEIDEQSLLAIVEPGVVTGNLHQTVEEQGLFYPPDPASLDECTIGGNVSENAGGPRAFHYGVTSHFVLGMEVVTMGGTRFNTGQKSVKGVSGFNLPVLLTGSEGTLGVFSRIMLKLLPKPADPGIILVFFRNVHQAGTALTNILTSSLFPMSMELLDQTSLEHIQGVEGFTSPPDAGGALICEFEGLGTNKDLKKRALARFKESNPLHLQIAVSKQACDQIWAARRKVSTKLKENHKHKISEDIALPRIVLPHALKLIEKIARKNDLVKGCYGHAGDGNLHVNFLSDQSNPELAFSQAVQELFSTVISLGGTLSGEHGIGLSKKQYMQIEHDPNELAIMKAIKKAWDPWNLLNPGKILP
ncbi:MAG: FAD-binding oxidoreductase [Myxococcota bacterium]